jgi:predicted permease
MSDLDDEIRSHLEHEIDNNMARGMTRAKAEAAAYRKFGNRTRAKEDVWRLGPWAWLDGVRQDLRYALRMMRKNWGFTAIAVASLALGIGGNTALFSLVDRLMLRTLPVREPERLVEVIVVRRAFTANGYPYPAYERMRSLELFEGIAGWRNRVVKVEWNGAVRDRRLALVTGEYFPTLGLKPVIGRLLDTKDDSPAGGDAAVISYAVWDREFQLRPSVLGQTLQWDRGLFTVVGVAPPAFHGVEVGPPPEIYLPFHGVPRAQPKNQILTMWDSYGIHFLARLMPGTTAAQVEPLLTDRVHRRNQADGLKPADGFERADGYKQTFILAPGNTGFSRLRSQFGDGLWILLGLSGMVLAAACANLASLQLLRADARQREMSIRAAAGATAGRIVRQWLTESLLLSVAGGMAGWSASHWITSGLLLFLPEAQRGFYQFALDGRVLVVSLVVTVATALVFGVLPGWRAARESGWRPAGRGSAGARSARWVKAAMALQLAASLVLILGAALFARSLGNLVGADTGFDREGLVVASLQFPSAPSQGLLRPERELLEQVRSLPQVKSAALAWDVPLGEYVYWDPLKVRGYVPAPAENTTVLVNALSPGYFATMGIPLLAGRDFNEHDTRGAPRVGIVSESLARRYFSRVDVTGEVVGAGMLEQTQQLRIVGVVGNSRYSEVREGAKELLYLALLQVSPEYEDARAVVRPQPGVTPAALMASLRALGTHPAIQANLNLWAYSDTFNRSIQQDRMLAILAAVFGSVGAGLALVGLYGAMAFTVSRRTAELGVRMALGGRPGQIAGMVVRETAALAALGLVIGVPLGALASRLVAARLYQVQPFDRWAVAAVALVMVAVSFAAALVPAWRAARVDPAVALRAE